MIEKINIPVGSSFFETNLDGESIIISMYYSKISDRYIMDIENKRLNRKTTGIQMNVGVDLLNQSGRIGLQALVLASAPKPEFEASLINFEENLKLLYMDLITYDNMVLGNGGTSRRQWIEQTPNAF